jgi:hypothetical protein
MLKHRSLTLALLMSAGVLISACGKKTDAPAPEATAPAPAASAPQTNAAPATEEDSELVAKREAIEFALMEDKIKNDPKGQWAVSAKASSTYSSDANDSTSGYHAFRATGAPDTERYGDQETSWASKESDQGIEWIELEYANPVNATALKIRQNLNPGAIISVDLFDEAGSAHNIWQGPDATKYRDSTISWLNLNFEKTAYKTKRVKITLATNAVSGWNEIDAVQLLGE